MKVYIKSEFVNLIDSDPSDLIPLVKQWFNDRGYSDKFNTADIVYANHCMFYFSLEMDDEVYVHFKLDDVLKQSSYKGL
jgi:hypothetical protein